MPFPFLADIPPIPLTYNIPGYFILPGDIPANAEQGYYSITLVALSYVIVTVASYVALGIAGKLTSHADRSQRIKIICGALAMGAGIWSMHFIGMLAYQMRMLVTYNAWITALSMVVAIGFAGAAFFVIRGKELSLKLIFFAAPLLGLAVCGMHYIGMQAMEMDAKLLYRPDLFFLSFVIAATASAAALKMMFHARGSRYPAAYNLLAAMTMGVAVCGMHYTGMAASVFLPFADCRYVEDQDFSGMATAVALITLLIVFISFLVKQLDEALAEMQQRTAQLFQAQKMEAVGQLTGGIAHDFNNMLGIIIGNFELLSLLPSMPEKAAAFIRTGMEGAMKASELTQRLLAFSRKQVLQPVPSDMAKLVPTVLTLASRAVGPGIAIRADIPDGLPMVQIDPIHFESSILNLILNARDAMPLGGEIAISASTAHFDAEEAAARQLPPGNYIAVRVSDNGEGMSEEVKARAVDPFFTTKEVGKGSGMGLSMVFGFAKQSGGNIDIESQPGKGTTITIYLPVAAEQALRPQPQPPKKDSAASHLRIVVVDDEKNLRAFMETALARLGHEVHAADNAEEALSALEKHHADLLITDVLMPRMNGYQLAERACALHPELKVLFISGFAQKESLPDFLPKSRCGFLAKPFTLSALAQAIKGLV